jgi:hypothetical protein
MPLRSAGRLAWASWALCVLVTLAGLVLLVVNGSIEHANSSGSPYVDAVVGFAFLAYPTIGAAIAAREPRNAIGWLFIGAGLGNAVEDAGLGYATWTLERDPGVLPGGEVAALVADAVWLPSVAAATLLLFILFPTGRPLSRVWGWVVAAFAVDMAAFVVATLVNPGPLYFFPGRANPWGVPALDPIPQVVLDLASPAIFASLVLGLVALTLRFRRARGRERMQLKWLFYAAAVWTALTPVLIVLSERELTVGGVLVSDVCYAALVVAVPIAVGAAILRHRLYDIDVVVNRTLVYLTLTLALVATYLGAVLAFRLLFDPLTRESDLAVAASTLAVAALFRPLRSRIQSGVDRRFYRARYDASVTLSAFTGRMRDELDLEAVDLALRGVVRQTVAPAHVTLWLREGRS